MNDTTAWLDGNAGGSSSPGVSLANIGDTIVGSVANPPRKVDTEFGERLVIELTAADGTTAKKGTRGAEGLIEPGEVVSLWIKPGAMASALRDAVKTAGATGINLGDSIAMAYTADGVASKPGWNPPKQYSAKVVPARASISLDDLL
jgi:hypothetical protein